jgi:hypothetical protein
MSFLHGLVACVRVRSDKKSGKKWVLAKERLVQVYPIMSTKKWKPEMAAETYEVQLKMQYNCKNVHISNANSAPSWPPRSGSQRWRLRPMRCEMNRSRVATANIRYCCR